MRILVGAVVMLFMSTPLIGHAAVPEPFTYSSRLIGMRQIPGTLGAVTTAVRTGDAPTLQVYVHSDNGAPSVSADLSDFGLSSSATTTGTWLGYGALYYPAYFYNFGPLPIIADIPDGVHSVSIIATSATGSVHASTTSIVVDNALPTVILSDITFSATPPHHGDFMYLSGSLDGTGSAAKASQVMVYLSDVSGNPVVSPVLGGSAFGLDPKSINDALATSTSGLFSNVPIRLSTYGDPELISRATNFTVELVVYDEAGNFGTTRLTVPVPKPLPPDPCAVPGTCASNVLFLPGIEGSRLYEGTGCGKSAEEKLWEPYESFWGVLRGVGDAKIADLALDSSGASVCSDIYTKPGDILDAVGGNGLYASFVSEMDGLKSGTINDWKPVAYDWRLSFSDLLTKGTERDGKIYYEEATSTPYIEQTLRSLAASSKTGKVTIVAHSNGGLVAKALLNALGGETAKSLVDRVIMVAVPQSGTPSAVGSLLVGYNAGIYKYGIPIVSNQAARAFSQNSPMAYHLLPSSDYLSTAGQDAAHPVIKFSGSGYAEEKAAYGDTVTTLTELDDFFLARDGGRTQAVDSDLLSAKILNPSLIDYANSTHAPLDAWVPPEGIEVDQIAGWGIDTVGGIDFTTPNGALACASCALNLYNPVFVEDGDGTVTVPSALMIATSANVKRYWVDLRLFNKDYSSQNKHANLFEMSPLRDFIKNLMKGSSITSTYIKDSVPTQNDIENKLTYLLHSPLTLELTDALGNVTGLGTDGSIDESIPGSTYGEFGEVKYVTVPAGSTYQLTMHGQSSGTFTLDAQETSGGTVVASSTIAGVPTTVNTMVTMDIQPDQPTLSPMSIDKDGDGTTDVTITPRLNDTVVFDITPPELRVTFSTTTQALAFTATDDSGSATLSSTTTYPVLRKKQREYRGTALTTVTARDGAGNTTSLVYTEQLPSPKGRDTIILKGLAYNGATTTLSSTNLSYKWSIGKNDSYQVFASYLRAASTSLESHYRPRRDKTNIMTRPRELDDSGNDDSDMRPKRQVVPGMVIPYVTTEKGSLLIKY